jgi:hypothetical protein
MLKNLWMCVNITVSTEKIVNNKAKNIGLPLLGEKELMHPLITRDPVSGEELIVTRLECPASGVTIEGRFSLGWIGRLTREQLDFVELLVMYRGNIQKLAQEMNIAYNTARSRLDGIVTALGGTSESEVASDRRAILDRLAAKEISVEEAMRLLKG